MFYKKVGEIKEGKEKQFHKDKKGNFMFIINNKIVYTNGEYIEPSINGIVEIKISRIQERDLLCNNRRRGDYV